MRTVAFFLACLACTGNGRRVDGAKELNQGFPLEGQQDSKTVQTSANTLNSLAKLLLSEKAPAGWQAALAGSSPRISVKGRVGNRATLPVLARQGDASMREAEEGLKAEALTESGADSVQRQDDESNLQTKVLASVVASVALFGLAQSALADGAVDDLVTQVQNSGFGQAFVLIFASEIGDKTFFLAGLLAAKYSRLISLTGSIGALAVMTVISTAIGQIFHSIPEGITQGIPFDDYAAVAAFTYFGGKTLYDAFLLPEGDSSGIDEEREEAEEIVAKEYSEEKRRDAIAAIAQTFGLVFAAEIGDRSFLSTIALSAAQNPFSVSTGAISAHAAATGLAVQGGAVMSKYLSEKVIGYIGGTFFLVFAATTALDLVSKLN